jgi:Arylsulfotransferase (ASST)
MKNIFYLLGITLALLANTAAAQVNPPDSSQLNYTTVLFESKHVSNATHYVFEVADDVLPLNFDSKNLIAESNSKLPSALIYGFSFGGKYKWRVKAYNKKALLNTSATYGFQIMGSPKVDTARYRARVLTNTYAPANQSAIMLDYSGYAINRQGTPIWYLPSIPGVLEGRERIRDMRLTPFGTVTFLTDKVALECSLDGKPLWMAPDDGTVADDTAEFYHHCFQRLNSGNYMLLGNKYVYKSIPWAVNVDSIDSKLIADRVKKIGDTTYIKVEYGTIIEYNAFGDVVWSWNSLNYFSDAELFARKTPEGLPDVLTHLNAFTVDEVNNKVYAGFRNISRLIVIDKATGKIEQQYGENILKGPVMQGNGLFKNQHDAYILPNNQLAIFNNSDSSLVNPTASLMVLNQPNAKKDKITIARQVACADESGIFKNTRGGNVCYLPNGNFMVCMGSATRVFEVDANNKIVWDCYTEINRPKVNTWNYFPQYRAHYTTSLYPVAFGLNTKSTIISATKGFSYTVYNLGSNADSYTTTITNAKGLAVYKYTTGQLVPESNILVDVKLTGLTPGDVLMLTTTSNTNKTISKKLSYTVQ